MEHGGDSSGYLFCMESIQNRYDIIPLPLSLDANFLPDNHFRSGGSVWRNHWSGGPPMSPQQNAATRGGPGNPQVQGMGYRYHTYEYNNYAIPGRFLKL